MTRYLVVWRPDLSPKPRSWMSSGRTVSVSVRVYEDGHMSPPCVVGAGKGRLVTTELERACAAIDALCRYVRARHVWGAR